MAHLPLSLLLHFSLLFSLNTHLSTAVDTISLGQSLTGNQTIVSKGGSFELGFFTPGNSHNYYIGIWYKKLPIQTVFWVANREAPITNTSSAVLRISNDGNLVLLEQSNLPVWSSNSIQIPADSAVAVLLDTGNLVIRNGSASDTEIWQSFAHPTDTAMPGGWIGVDKITGEYQTLTSWRSSEDPAPGRFMESMDPDGSNQYVLLWNGSKIYWTSGLWNGQYFSNVPGTKEQTAFNFTFIDDSKRKFATYTITVSSVITRFVVDSTGQGKLWLWMDSSQEWSPIFTFPLDQCNVYSLCGPFGVCDKKSSSICRCSDGFEPSSTRDWDLNDWSSGCVRKTRLQCGINGVEQDGFLPMGDVQLPENPQSLTVGSARDCKMACLNNCSCNAYAYDSGCSIWTGDLRNLQQLHDANNGAGTLFLRLAASDLPTSSNLHQVVIVTTLSVAAGIIAILCAVLVTIWARRMRRSSRITKQTDGSPIIFTYGDLQRMTKNFSDKLGSGGFGSVYKGTMPDSTVIAVKKLEGFTQGEKQFRTELRTLGAIQHGNLARLRGFCIERSKRLLVYEYMARGSLDSNLFGDCSSVLGWRIRYRIILGAAKGLAYLHEQCRECIIHCDIKPDNILLDEEFSPKLSDFGMAKLIGRDFSRVLTTMRGTIGYLAPEWISGLPITPKVDVYSFGMMLFEIISGRRNIGHSEDARKDYFPLWAARQIIEGKKESLLDPRLEGDADMEELERACRVACWCIQDSEEHRPPMGQVVQILEAAVEVNMAPVPMALQNLVENNKGPLFYQYEDQDEVDISQGSDHDASKFHSAMSSFSFSVNKH